MKHLLIAVGSRREEICSIGAFARAEAKGMQSVFDTVTMLEPDEQGRFPIARQVTHTPDVIFFHAPALYDRKRPWNAIKSALLLKKAFPKARFIAEVHEYFEAPLHWKIRQIILAKLSDAIIVNTKPDYDGMLPWNSKVLKSQLGPTMYSRSLIDNPSTANVNFERAKSREAISKAIGLDLNKKWVLHPGLVTPGKGVDQLIKFSPYIPESVQFVMVGGQGPKKKDRFYASGVVEELRHAFKEHFEYVDSPDDLMYQDFLLASDLVVLPYDIGLSERRSSFLSAMCCGGNVWTTVGRLSEPLLLEKTGVHKIPLQDWVHGDQLVLRSVYQAAAEDESEATERRIKNLMWAKGHTWAPRAAQVIDFLKTI